MREFSKKNNVKISQIYNVKISRKNAKFWRKNGNYAKKHKNFFINTEI